MELFRKSAGYRFLDAFVLANVVELGTGHFCERFLDLRNDPGGRTYAQMTHAARSGCRNFAEGSERLMTSYSTALELLDVARASLCELRDDYNKWLMDKYIKSVGAEFVEKGGFRERMSTVRSEARTQQDGAVEGEGPKCPQCGAPTRLRKTRKDNKPFWGCTGYPACRGVVDFEKNRQQSTAADSNR